MTDNEELKNSEKPGETTDETGGETIGAADNETNSGGETGENEGAMSLIEHLEELRWRIIKIIGAVTVTSTVSYLFVEDFIRLVTSPVGKLYYMNPTEAFFAYIKVSIFVGFLFALPVVMHQIWAFTVPALTQNERQAGVYLVPASLVFFFLGLAFSYYLVLPVGIKFFMGFATENLQPLFSLGDYISFVITFLLPFGLVFELPLVILVLAKFGIVDSEYLVTKRKHVLVMSFVLGLLISPTPDIFSQTMIAVPTIVLYEGSILTLKHIMQK